MGPILSLLGTAIPFGGVIIAGLLVAGGGLYGYERIQVADLSKENTQLHYDIDGPSGYIAQIGRANANLAVANKNIDELTKSVAGLNVQIDSISDASMAAAKRTKALQVALAASEKRAATVAAILASQRPAEPSYAALTGLIRQAVQP